MHLYDTLERKVRELKPLDGKTFRFYCCGPTVYGPAHIGNFRTFVVQDTFRRVLELSGMPTFHVRNITDVDDKTIRDSQASGESLSDFTARWTEFFHRDCNALGLLPPHQEPGAVAHIAQQIELIEKLIEKGHAYVEDDGSVYFRVKSFGDYGKLSRLSEREITSTTSSERQSSDEYERESVSDFALWKAHKPEDGPNFWESPWGQGRPGWHIECSAKCMTYLGESFDLHSGGIDLIFPHHENEIAQSEAVTGKQFAAHWFHITHLLVDGGKMSKSKGNLYTIDDIKERGYSALELRYVLLMGHYRKPLNFTFQSFQAARPAIERLRRLALDLVKISQCEFETDHGALIKFCKGGESLGIFSDAFQSLLDDLNTAEAFGKLFTAVKEIEGQVRSGTLDKESARAHQNSLSILVSALGLNGFLSTESAEEIPEEVLVWAEERQQAKKDKNFELADTLREKITNAGWSVQDGPDGFELKPV